MRRFWAKVSESNKNGCRLWLAGKNKTGYGYFWLNGSNTYAHRVSYELAYGEFCSNLYICRKCDIPSCVEPTHLFLGTAKDNTKDMFAKGRQNYSCQAKGEDHVRAKLTVQQVNEIRQIARKISQKDLASKYNVTRGTIYRVQTNKFWRHVK